MGQVHIQPQTRVLMRTVKQQAVHHVKQTLLHVEGSVCLKQTCKWFVIILQGEYQTRTSFLCNHHHHHYHHCYSDIAGPYTKKLHLRNLP
jgi:hypothetical protein